MPYTIGKTFKFDAAHQLSHLPEDHKCSRLHGHTYHVTVELESAELDADGFVLDYGALAPFKRWVDDTLDHRNLNDVVPGGMKTTAECLAAWLWGIAHDVLPDRGTWRIVAVTVKETENTFSRYAR